MKFSENDIQSVGRVNFLNLGTKYPLPKNFSLEGQNKFDMIGLNNDIGDPFGNGSVVLAVGVPGEDVDGVIFTLPWKLTQAGVVYLYEVGADGKLTQIARYDSDRRYARFGTLVMVSKNYLFLCN